MERGGCSSVINAIDVDDIEEEKKARNRYVETVRSSYVVMEQDPCDCDFFLRSQPRPVIPSSIKPSSCLILITLHRINTKGKFVVRLPARSSSRRSHSIPSLRHRTHPTSAPSTPQQRSRPLCKRRPNGESECERELQPEQWTMLPPVMEMRAAGLTRNRRMSLPEAGTPSMSQRGRRGGSRRGVESPILQSLLNSTLTLVFPFTGSQE